MKTREQVLALLHQRTRGAHSDSTIGNEPVRVKDLLAVMEFCEVIIAPTSSVVIKDGLNKQPSTLAGAREAAIKAGDIALGKMEP